MKQIDYRAIFYLGISLIAVGVVFMSAVNPGLGTVFIAIGGLNMIIGAKNKWGKK